MWPQLSSANQLSPGKHAEVWFAVIGGNLNKDSLVSIHGNCPELGNWDKRTKENTFTFTPASRTNVCNGGGATEEALCVLKGGVVFQKKITITVPDSGVLRYKYKIKEQWEHDGDDREQPLGTAVWQYTNKYATTIGMGRRGPPTFRFIDILGETAETGYSFATTLNWDFTPDDGREKHKQDVSVTRESHGCAGAQDQGAVSKRPSSTSQAPDRVATTRFNRPTVPALKPPVTTEETQTPPVRLLLHYANGQKTATKSQLAFAKDVGDYICEAFAKKGIRVEILKDDPDQLVGIIICRDRTSRAKNEVIRDAILSGFKANSQVLGLSDAVSLESLRECPHARLPVWLLSTFKDAPGSQPGIPYNVDIKKAWWHGTVHDHVVRMSKDGTLHKADAPHALFDEIALAAISQRTAG
ncbi:unnamed protein product [Vitrella brassicaformis CCMP3155]|uniref:Uncharacterized protein n=1 Tax=Vitrella brassicaformis (strain CCMP3155) TaxID=1169540 RepID=A0A0G4GHB3_VITBC|nr:unnamed protein product [Vitrella brassicaformis CCMP3155]|eukprot:CEM29114.1 unnamed protein product [Vitrella brassicaformis CCMP3155]